MVQRRAVPFVSVLLALAGLSGVAEADTLTGRVLGPDDKPVAGAEVALSLTDAKERPLIITDATGAYSVEIDPKAFKSDFWGRATACADGLSIGGITLSKSLRTFDIRLRSAVTVAGRVQDGDGRPVAGANVVLSSAQWPAPEEWGRTGFASVPKALSPRFTAVSAADGRWTMAGLPENGTATFTLEHRPYARITLTVQTAKAGEANILVARPEAVIEGKVTHGDGKPAPGMEVQAYTENGNGSGGKATSGEDGTYRIDGLTAGPYQLSFNDPGKQWVAAPVAEVATREGTVSQALPFVLDAGAIIEGIVTDAESGVRLKSAQLAGYDVLPRRTYSYGSTDADGRYRIRVLPGKHIVVATYMKGYLFDEGDETYRIEVEVARGDTKTADFKLRKGLVLVATVVDEAGRPVADEKISVTRQHEGRGRWVEPIEGKTDAAGKWKGEGFSPGTWRVGTGDAWKVETPVLQLPVASEVRIKLRRLTQASLKGRVVDTGGLPLAGASVKPLVVRRTPPNEMYSGSMSGSPRRPELTTNTAGEFVVPEIVPDSIVTLTVAKPGFVYASGGKVTEVAGAYSVTDIVLAPLTAKLKGVVTDVAKTPVAGAEVFCPEGGPAALTTTDAAGRFEFPALPAGAVTLIAVSGNSAVTAAAKTSENVSLALVQRTPPKGRDIWRANEIFAQAKLDRLGRSGGEGAPDNSGIAILLAPYSPDMALQAGTDFYGNLADQVVLGVIQKIGKVDPVRAALWAPAKLEAMKSQEMRFYATLILGSAVAAVDPEIGLTLYREGRKLAAGRQATHPMMTAFTNTSLWKMAAALKQPEVAEYRTAILEMAKQQTDNDMLMAIVEGVAAIDSGVAETIMEQVPSRERLGRLDSVLRVLSRTEPATALRWLEKVAKSSDERAAAHFGYAALPVIRALGPTDPAAALALARRVPHESRATALMLAARFQSKELAISLIEEVAPGMPVTSNTTYNRARLAALLYQLDRAAGKKLFATAKMGAEEDTEQPDTMATFAFYYSRVDPAQSRIVLEREFARHLDKARQNYATNSLYGLVGAMAAVDIDRALQLFELVPEPNKDDAPNNPYQRQSVLQSIGRYLLATETQRAVMEFRPGYVGMHFNGDDDD